MLLTAMHRRRQSWWFSFSWQTTLIVLCKRNILWNDWLSFADFDAECAVLPAATCGYIAGLPSAKAMLCWRPQASTRGSVLYRTREQLNYYSDFSHSQPKQLPHYGASPLAASLERYADSLVVRHAGMLPGCIPSPSLHWAVSSTARIHKTGRFQVCFPRIQDTTADATRMKAENRTNKRAKIEKLN